MKYILIDICDSGDEYTEEFDDIIEALDAAYTAWNQLSSYDQRHRKAMYVLKSAEPDEDSEQHFDGDPIFYIKRP